MQRLLVGKAPIHRPGGVQHLSLRFGGHFGQPHYTGGIVTMNMSQLMVQAVLGHLIVTPLLPFPGLNLLASRSGCSQIQWPL